jgi:transposase
MAEGSDSESLFGSLPIPEPRLESARGAPAPRVLLPNRQQMEMRPVDLESLLPEDHKARIVWGYVEQQDLSALYERIKAVEGGVGRPAIAPQILMPLWLYATLEAVGSARALERLCEAHDAYRWLCGGVRVNYHTLANFRTQCGEFLDRLLTRNVAALLASGAVTMVRVAQDGMRVRADAGTTSFRRKTRITDYLAQARDQIAVLKRELEDDPEATHRRQQAARERAVKERERRIKQALSRIPQLEKIKHDNGQPIDKTRASITDADASVMKMADGGYRPAYNAQLATDTQTQVIVGVDITTRGSDKGLLAPMVEQLESRYERRPEQMLVDGGFTHRDDIEKLAPKTAVYAPPPKPQDPQRDPHAPLPTDSPALAEWRTRMGTPEAKAIYKERASTAECVNALARNRGLTRFNVRGLDKVKSVLLWYALAHNLMRMAELAPQMVGLA